MAKRPLSSHLTLTAEGGESTEISDLPVPIMQALYYQITGKKEKIEKSFRDDFIIEKHSISDLMLKIEQTVEQFSLTSSNFSSTIFRHKKDKQV
ncbi:hypothetical protein [Jiella sp. M17.18]|uniref:hypothetical protein n=1 Tax=Jiella sp. M17.18 TaxID=3234247 RepID=UPI0034DEFED9